MAALHPLSVPAVVPVEYSFTSVRCCCPTPVLESPKRESRLCGTLWPCPCPGWDLEYNKVIRHYHGHLSGVYTLALHPTLDILVTGGRDCCARVWDMRSKNQIHSLVGHQNTVASLLTQGTDPQIISGAMDSMVKVRVTTTVFEPLLRVAAVVWMLMLLLVVVVVVLLMMVKRHVSPLLPACFLASVAICYFSDHRSPSDGIAADSRRSCGTSPLASA